MFPNLKLCLKYCGICLPYALLQAGTWRGELIQCKPEVRIGKSRLQKGVRRRRKSAPPNEEGLRHIFIPIRQSNLETGSEYVFILRCRLIFFHSILQLPHSIETEKMYFCSRSGHHPFFLKTRSLTPGRTFRSKTENAATQSTRETLRTNTSYSFSSFILSLMRFNHDPAMRDASRSSVRKLS